MAAVAIKPKHFNPKELDAEGTKAYESWKAHEEDLREVIRYGEEKLRHEDSHLVFLDRDARLLYHAFKALAKAGYLGNALNRIHLVAASGMRDEKRDKTKAMTQETLKKVANNIVKQAGGNKNIVLIDTSISASPIKRLSNYLHEPQMLMITNETNKGIRGEVMRGVEEKGIPAHRVDTLVSPALFNALEEASKSVTTKQTYPEGKKRVQYELSSPQERKMARIHAQGAINVALKIGEELFGYKKHN